MKTTRVYTEEQVQQLLVAFGNYMMSNTRRKLFEEKDPSAKKTVIQERLLNVTDADLANFMENIPETVSACKICFNNITYKIKTLWGLLKRK